MGGLVFRVLKKYYVLSLCILLSEKIQADLGIEDPTRPIYEQPVRLNALETDSADQGDDIDSSIPPLSQLVFSQNRQIAIFGDLMVRVGDDTHFGKIVAIHQDRVIIDVQGKINEIIFSIENPLKKPLK